MADLQKIVDDLSKLTVREAADLATLLKTKWEREPAASRLSDDELKSARTDLESGYTPEEFFQKIVTLKKRVTDKELFNAPRMKFVREAMALGEFAKQLKGASRVRLTVEADRFPDGFVETPDGILEVEFTEADMQTRRRGDEYKADKPRGESAEEWEKQAKAIPVELNRAIRHKVDMNYDSPPTLLVYLNLDGHGTHKAEVESMIADAKRKYAASFKGIHVLWNDRLL